MALLWADRYLLLLVTFIYGHNWKRYCNIIKTCLSLKVSRWHLWQKVIRRHCFVSKYHLKIKLSTELTPSKPLDTKLTFINGFYKFDVYRKEKYKTTITMDLQTPKRYKQHTFNGSLHRSKRISSNFDE